MSANGLEVADIFRRHADAWLVAHAAHVSRAQCRVISAITACRTAALGGHVELCGSSAHARIAYNSCRNRHCPKCQWAASRKWLEDRKAELLPVHYFHVVFTLPSAIGAIAFQNKAKVYDLLFKTAAETLLTIAADPRHLGARVGLIAVLHSWGQTLDHHPHLHCIVPGGGLSACGTRWLACKPGFFLPVRVLSRLFRRLFLPGLEALHEAGELRFFGSLADLADRTAFDRNLEPLRQCEWVVYAKRPFAGPEQVLGYLARYTHRVAIANSRLIALADGEVSFRWKDCRHEQRPKVMLLDAGEFIRRFLMHTLPSGFHRIRHYGLLANTARTRTIAFCRELLGMRPSTDGEAAAGRAGQRCTERPACPCCGGPMIIIIRFAAFRQPVLPVLRPIGFDTS